MRFNLLGGTVFISLRRRPVKFPVLTRPLVSLPAEIKSGMFFSVCMHIKNENQYSYTHFIRLY